jgi:two-component system sensor histidine kinase UhpB
LHPTILDDYGIEAGIERLVQTWSRQTKIPVDYQREGKARLPDGTAIHVYRIAQEALNNIAKHARATEVEVRLDFDAGMLKMRIADDGVGIASHPAGGLGLTAMRERAELIHANISISRGANRGTLVALEVPTE